MFEDVKANIELLESKGAITVEELLDSMCRLFDGAGKMNEMVVNIEDYGDALINLFDRIVPSYRQVADKLRNLNDEDVNEVIDDSRRIAKELSASRTVVESLIVEKKRLDALNTEYEKVKEQQYRLQSELKQMKNFPVESVKRANEQLQEEIKALEKRQEELQKKKEKAEQEEDQLKKSIAEFEQWNRAFDERIKTVRRKSLESTAMYTSIKNAWKSVCMRDDLPTVLESSEIKSFPDLERWFDDTGDEIERKVVAYTEMYKRMVDIFNKSVE